MVHHADVAQAAIRVLNVAVGDGRVFNVAGDEPIAAGVIAWVISQSVPADVMPASFDQWEGIVDTMRSRAELGFSPTFPSLDAARRAEAL